MISFSNNWNLLEKVDSLYLKVKNSIRKFLWKNFYIIDY